jgi:hypothetical protein
MLAVRLNSRSIQMGEKNKGNREKKKPKQDKKPK